MVDEFFFEKYGPPPVIYGPWPSDGHPFWKFVDDEYQKMLARCRALAAEYFASMSQPQGGKEGT